MVIKAHVYVEHPKMALAPTIRSLSDVEIGVVSDAGTDPDHDIHFFWVRAPDFDAVESAFVEDGTVASFSAIVEMEEQRTYRIEYSPEAKLVSPPLTETGSLTQEAVSHLNGWLLTLHFKDHDGLYALSEYAAAEDITIDIIDLQQTDGKSEQPEFGLTEPQRDALVAAFLHGYYDDPRETSLEELAGLLDISPTAVSGRLRRGSARLIEEVLLDEDDDS
jgi:predicted DNA binding protein